MRAWMVSYTASEFSKMVHFANAAIGQPSQMQRWKTLALNSEFSREPPDSRFGRAVEALTAAIDEYGTSIPALVKALPDNDLARHALAWLLGNAR